MRAARGTIEKSVPMTRPSAHSPPVSCVWKAVAAATAKPRKMAGERPNTRAHLGEVGFGFGVGVGVGVGVGIGVGVGVGVESMV